MSYSLSRRSSFLLHTIEMKELQTILGWKQYRDVVWWFYKPTLKKTKLGLINSLIIMDYKEITHMVKEKVTKVWESQHEVRAEEQIVQRSPRHIHQVIPLNKLLSSSTAHLNPTLLLEQNLLWRICSLWVQVTEDSQLFSLLSRYTSSDKAFPYGLKSLVYPICS